MLLKHPEGLPWQDIIKIININKFTRNEISERRIPGRIFDNENVYLSERGTYRHVKFANFESIDIEKVLLDILYYFDGSNDSSIHLYSDYYRQRRKYLGINYYKLRYVVRNYGEEHGIYFVGQSHVDTISLQSNPYRVTAKDAILNILKKSDKSLTIAEIAQATRSKNQLMAFYIIQALQQDDKVLRVDQKLYTTPDKVFQFVDLDKILSSINDIIQSTSCIIESDVFRENLNPIFNFSYSKYFYASLAAINRKNFSWHCKNQLFCKYKFSYKSISEIMDEICKFEIGKKKNLAEVQKIVWFTRKTADSAYSNWMFKHKFMQITGNSKEKNCC